MPIRTRNARLAGAAPPAAASPGAQRRAALRALAAGRLPPGTADPSLPRLRFDRVAQRLVKSLQAALEDRVPSGSVLLITVTAPIRLPARTVVEIQARLARGLPVAFSRIICGNRVRAQMMSAGRWRGAKVIVFVHNCEPSPRGLCRLVEQWLGH